MQDRPHRRFSSFLTAFDTILQISGELVHKAIGFSLTTVFTEGQGERDGPGNKAIGFSLTTVFVEDQGERDGPGNKAIGLLPTNVFTEG